MASKNDTIDEIVDGFMRYARKTPPFENVSITAAYATKLCQRIKAVHNLDVARLRDCIREAIYIKCGYCRDFYKNCPTICDLNKKRL